MFSERSNRLTSHKISYRWRERVSPQVECGSHRKLERGAASGSLHRLVRCNGSLDVHVYNATGERESHFLDGLICSARQRIAVSMRLFSLGCV